MVIMLDGSDAGLIPAKCDEHGVLRVRVQEQGRQNESGRYQQLSPGAWAAGSHYVESDAVPDNYFHILRRVAWVYTGAVTALIVRPYIADAPTGGGGSTLYLDDLRGLTSGRWYGYPYRITQNGGGIFGLEFSGCSVNSYVTVNFFYDRLPKDTF